MKEQRIKNKYYREFLDENTITTIKKEQIKEVIDKIKHPKLSQAKALVSIAYLTGSRPSEFLKLTNQDVEIFPNHIDVKIKPTKNGLPRTLRITRQKNALCKYFTDYYVTVPPSHPNKPIKLFNAFITKYTRKTKTKKGKDVEYQEPSAKLRYWFYKWFSVIQSEPITPYFLRHNRLSMMAQDGASFAEMKWVKGAKSIESVTPYVHMSKQQSIKMMKYLK